MMREGDESSSDGEPGFDQDEQNLIEYGGEYQKGEEEFKGHLVKEENESIDEDAIFEQEWEFLNQDKFKEIEKIENEMASEKPWMLKGEVTGKHRPLNSLLAEHLDFDIAMKLPEKVTKETTNKIEVIIKSRVLDGLFDDPIRKSISTRKRVSAEELMNFEKSKKGLADIYEQDFKE